MKRTYRFPRTGKSRYSVTVAEDGAIRVRRGDSLDQYSMAIHGVPFREREYLRYRGNRLVPVQNVDLIYTGETLVHAPTLAAHKKRSGTRISFAPITITASSPSTPEQHRAVIKLLKREANLSHEQAQELLGYISKGCLAGKTLLQVLSAYSVGAFAEIGACVAGGFGAMVLSCVSIGIGFYKAINTGNAITEALGCCHGITAWVFNEPPPGMSRKLAQLHQKSGVSGGNLKAYQAAWDRGVMRGTHDIMKVQQKKKIPADLFCAIVQHSVKGNKEKLCSEMSKGVAEKLNHRFARPSFEAAIKAGVVYPN